MPGSHIDSIVDKIYEAAVVPELWPLVLHDLATLVNGVGAAVMATDLRQVARWTASQGVHQVLVDWVDGGWQAKNQRTQRMVRLQHPGFVTTLDAFEPWEVETDLEHQEFLKPRGLGLSTGTFIPMPTGDIVVYSIERALGLPNPSQQDVALLDRLRPHLARAGIVAARLGLERAKVATEAFASLGLAAAALNGSGRMLAGNGLLGEMIPSIVQDRRERLCLTHKPADMLLEAGLRGSGSLGETLSIPIPQMAERPACIVHLLPIRGAAHDIFSQVAWLAIVMPVVPGQVPGAEMLQALFDLTPAEARVARSIAQARTIAELAGSLKLSELTVRTQLKAVFGKTGTHRQAELAALLSGLGLPEDRHSRS